MMELNKDNLFRFPQVTLDKVSPLIKHQGKVIVSELEFRFEDGKTMVSIETKGLELKGYIGKRFHCLLEITQGEIIKAQAMAPYGTIKGTYLWSECCFLFFPELMTIREEMQNALLRKEEELEIYFNKKATEEFANWGLAGLGIELYQAKPMISTTFGVILINEYQFEEKIEHWELDEEICVLPIEMYVRGIKLIDTSFENLKEVSNKRLSDSIFPVFLD